MQKLNFKKDAIRGNDKWGAVLCDQVILSK